MQDRPQDLDHLDVLPHVVRTSSFCSSGGCVGVAEVPCGWFDVIDTKTGSALRFSREEWVEFIAGVKHGEFDVLG